jgi:SPP1 gp7 family putative phage head morphogenesis protein
MPKNPFDLPDAEIIAAPVQPEAAIAFWAWKSAMSYGEAKKLADGAKERAFYVTALSEHDAVQGVKDALRKALEEGETLKDFQARIADVIASQGWRGDRIETIFRNNLQTAYMAGRYAKMQEVKEARPYWEYITVGDERVRPSHAVIGGIVYHADHEFWAENYPPNGHKCRCGVRTLSARQVEKEGLDVQTDMPGDSMWTDPKTGMEYHVARPGADDGWRNNPGKTWLESTGKALGAASGLPLDKYPDLTPESYAEQRLRPAPVKDFGELAQGIRDKCDGYCRNSKGFVGIFKSNEDSFMSTNCRGSLWISEKPYIPRGKKQPFIPDLDLKRAWNNLAAGKALDWNEEYAIESLWHEIIHNRQIPRHVGKTFTLKKQVMETVTQWTARRTYPDFLRSLGGNAAHLESIKQDGLGYAPIIKNFNKLIGVLKIDEAVLLQEMTRLIDTVPMDEYVVELTKFISKQSGHKKSAVVQALKATRGTEETFEQWLEYLEMES